MVDLVVVVDLGLVLGVVAQIHLGDHQDAGDPLDADDHLDVDAQIHLGRLGDHQGDCYYLQELALLLASFLQ
jgi:hypothetical protein